MTTRPSSTFGRALVKGARLVSVTIVGFALVMVGIVLLFLPGPGLLVIIAGLALLATEFAWARRLLVLARAQARQMSDRVRRR